jgi:hypothetical protein
LKTPVLPDGQPARDNGELVKAAMAIIAQAELEFTAADFMTGSSACSPSQNRGVAVAMMHGRARDHEPLRVGIDATLSAWLSPMMMKKARRSAVASTERQPELPSSSPLQHGGDDGLRRIILDQMPGHRNLTNGHS